MNELICGNCGKGFCSERKRKYCESLECIADRRRASTDKYKEGLRQVKLDTPQTCDHCSAEFFSGSKKKYCCYKCKDRHAHGVDPDYVRVIRTQEEKREQRRQQKSRARRRAGAVPMSDLKARTEVNRLKGKRKKRGGVWRKLWLTYQLTPAERYRHKYNSCPEFNLKERIRRQINKQKKKLGIAELMRAAIYRGGSSPKMEQELGYSIPELKLHLERQFIGRMSWDRFKCGDIHIDHITPVSSFDLTDPDEYQSCWALSNLQPLWAKDNLRKGAAIEKLL